MWALQSLPWYYYLPWQRGVMQGHPSACTQAEFGMFNDEPLAEHSWDFPVYTGERGTSKG